MLQTKYHTLLNPAGRKEQKQKFFKNNSPKIRGSSIRQKLNFVFFFFCFSFVFRKHNRHFAGERII